MNRASAAQIREGLRRHGLAVVIVGGASALVFGPALVLRSALFFRDILHYHWQSHQAVVAAIRAYSLPRWNSGPFMGIPLFGDLHAGVIYPPNLLYLVLSYPRAYAWLLWLHSAFGGMGVFAFIWQLTRRTFAGVAAALCFVLSGYVISLHCAGALMAGAAYVPWVLVAPSAGGKPPRAVPIPRSWLTPGSNCFHGGIGGLAVAPRLASTFQSTIRTVSVSLFDLKSVFAAGLALLGLIVGSFLNVIISRVPHDQSIIRPRSRCPQCGHQLAWFENVPVFSWVLLRGRCSSCRTPISWRYLVVELLTSILFLGCLDRFDWTWQLVPALTLVTLLIPLTFIDLEHWILPFSLTLPGVVLGLLLSIRSSWGHLRESFLGAVFGFIGFWALEYLGEKLFKKEALGGGDKYLLALLGAFLGYRSLLGLVFLASVQGAIVGIVLLLVFGRAGPAPAEPKAQAQRSLTASEDPEEHPLASQEEDWRPGPHNLPFGPWLSLAAIELMLLGPWLNSRLPLIVAEWFVGVS